MANPRINAIVVLYRLDETILNQALKHVKPDDIDVLLIQLVD